VLKTAGPVDMLVLSDQRCRPVDSRWRVAADRSLRAGYLPPPPHDDPWVERCTAFLLALLACRGEPDRQALADKEPDLDAAVRLYTGGDKIARGTLEARVLAGQTIPQVASLCGLSADAVAAYAALFFDVLGKLDGREYILANAIGPKTWHGLTEEDTDVLLKRAAFLKGPIYLEAFLRYYRAPLEIPCRLEGLSRERLGELLDLLLIRAVVLAWVLPPEKLSRVYLLQGLLQELKGLLAAWPGHAGERPGHPALALGAAGREAWWSLWRTGAEAASTGRGVEAFLKAMRVA
jgi:hypothetical protein